MAIPAILQNRLSLPIIAAPMFIVSSPELVIAECKAGIVGSFPALNARPAELLDVWLTQIETELSAYQAANPQLKIPPFAVNQICHKTNERLRHDTDICVKHKVPIIITSLQADAYVIDQTHSYGGIVLHDVTNIRHAQKALEHGVDGLILVGAGAGGHAGTLSPMALVSEIRSFYDGPIALSGAIANGASILAAQAMGADLAYMGTRFIATSEANALPDYKQMLIDSAAADIVYTPVFSGIPANYLKDSVTRNGIDLETLPSADKPGINFNLGNNKVKAWRDIWSAGQGTGSIKTIQSVAECIAELKFEYDAALIKLQHNHF